MDSNKKAKIVRKVVSEFKNKIDPRQLSKGMESEKEHAGETGQATNVIGTNKIKLAKIAVAHLKEDGKYYDHLKKMEDKYNK